MKPNLPSISELKAPRQLFDVLGPTLEFLLPPAEIPTSYCIMLGSIPPGVVVPLHSHIDDESFYQLAGTVDVLLQRDDELEWRSVGTGDFVHIAGGTKHAWRNDSTEPAVQLLTVTPRLARFFQEIARPTKRGAPPSQPTPEAIQRFVDVSARYGYWLGSADENAAVGIQLPGALANVHR